MCRRGLGIGGTHVDLARNGRRDQGSAKFVEEEDGASDFGDEGIDPLCLVVKKSGDGALLSSRRVRNWEIDEILGVDSRLADSN